MKEWLTSFAWVDEKKSLHIDIPTLLKEMRVADTPTNRDLATQWATDYLRRMIPEATIVTDLIVTDLPERTE